MRGCARCCARDRRCRLTLADLPIHAEPPRVCELCGDEHIATCFAMRPDGTRALACGYCEQYSATHRTGRARKRSTMPKPPRSALPSAPPRTVPANAELLTTSGRAALASMAARKGSAA
jgi:hypothetical protein